MDPHQSRLQRPGRRRGAGAPSGPDLNAASGRYRRLKNPFEPLRVLSEDEIAHIHESALYILENDGMRVLLPEARRRFAAAGAAVDDSSEMVRLDRGLVSLALSSAPSLIEVTAPDPGRNVTIGGRHLAVTPVSGPPNASDLDRGRRPGTLRDFREFLMLAQSFDVIHLKAKMAAVVCLSRDRTVAVPQRLGECAPIDDCRSLNHESARPSDTLSVTGYSLLTRPLERIGMSVPVDIHFARVRPILELPVPR
jgi:trimethylamine:corrinoid methyltransferase-like protein